MSSCDSYIQGIRMRATRLDECGAPVEGSCSTVVSKGFVSIAVSNNETSPTEISQVLADGTRAYFIQTPKILNNITATITFAEVDPELFELMTGSPLVLDDTTPTPVAQGFRTDSAAYGLANVALEVWTNLARSSCEVDGTTRRWGYYLMPWLYQGVVGKPTFENGSVNFTVNEAVTRDGTPWGTGPYDIQLDNTAAPSPLFSPLPSTTHDLIYKVNLEPPAASCGCTALVLPT